MTLSLFNEYHIGDCLCTAHLLRSLAHRNPDCRFHFFVHGNIIAQINEAVEDVANIDLFTFESDQWNAERHKAVNAWKNHQDHWVRSAHRWDWVHHQLEHHEWTAKRLGFATPFRYPTDLLFDYPALGPAVNELKGPWTSDWLVVNSDPRSGQFSPMRGENTGYLDRLIRKLGQLHSVMSTQPAQGALCTQAMGHSVSMIGKVSVRCQHHIMIATGPMWPTLNTHNNHLWNPKRKRIVILDNGESLRGIPWVQQFSRVEEVEDLLRGENLI